MKKAVAFLRVGPTSKVLTESMDVTHNVPSFLRIIIGGKQFAYPGFNG